MKTKVLVAIMSMIMLIVSFGGTGYADDNVRVKVNGQYIVFTDQEPIILDGRTMVPVRAVLEKLGAVVEWDEQNKIVRIFKDNRAVGLQINQKFMTVGELGANGQMVSSWNKEIDVAPQTIQSRTLLPIRCVVEEFGCTVGWDEANKTVIITDGAYVPVELKAIVIGE